MARMLGQLLNSVPDRTNVVPAEAESPQEWAARVGQEHDTWHRPEEVVTAPRPVLALVDPNPIQAGSPVTLRVSGSGFVEGAAVKVPTVFVGPTTFVSDTELTAEFTAPATPGLKSVLVQNPDGQFSNYVDLVIDEGMYPVVTGFSPDPMQIPAAGGYVPLTVIGTGFVDANPKVNAGAFLFDGNFVSDTEISCAAFEPSKLGPGPRPVRVKLGAATYSNYENLTIVAAPLPPPTVTSVAPPTAPMSVRTVFTISGTNFTPDTTAQCEDNNGNPISEPSVYVSATELTMAFTPPSTGPWGIEVRVPGAIPPFAYGEFVAV